MISIREADFDLNHEVEALRRESKEIGAIVTFTGLVRESAGDDQLAGMYLEHYPGMTEASILAIVKEAIERWDLLGYRVVHRVGHLAPGEQIVLVATSSTHRHAAFEAAEFIMDYLKTRAPFWKKEIRPDSEEWIGTRARDHDAADRW